MTENAKIIASSILVGAATIGVCITPLGQNNDNISVAIIIGLVGVVLLVQAWTGISIRSHFKKCIMWAKNYDNLDNRIDSSEDSEESESKKDA